MFHVFLQSFVKLTGPTLLFREVVLDYHDTQSQICLDRFQQLLRTIFYWQGSRAPWKSLNLKIKIQGVRQVPPAKTPSKFWSTRIHSSLRCSSDPNDNIGSSQTTGTSEAKKIIEWSTWTSVLGENFVAVRNLASTLMYRWCKQCWFNQDDLGDWTWFWISPRCLRSPWRLVKLKCLCLFVFKLLRNKWHHALPCLVIYKGSYCF